MGGDAVYASSYDSFGGSICSFLRHNNVAVTLELSRSLQVTRIAELPNVDVSQRQTPNKSVE